ncbi:MAG: hypothetical protein HY795_02295 [Desulfovibrio sp.]|nr:hypothetical protein [Desulfovibrio sp.]MBI4961166.1 hypothetical protein [Desulfovibrio sp.]
MKQYTGLYSGDTHEKDVRVTFHTSSFQKQWLAKLAKEEDVSLSQVVRKALDRWLIEKCKN